MKLRSFVTGLVMLFAIGGCSSPQIRNHTLVLPAPSAGPAKKVPFVIEVLPVGVPAQLDMKQVVMRQGDSTMQVLNNDRWMSTLGEEMHSALSPEIAQHLGTQDVSGLSKSDEKHVVRILIQIRRFDLWPGKRVRLDADWSLSTRNGDKRQLLVCQSQLVLSAPGDYLQVFPVAQHLVNQLAVNIAKAAKKWMEVSSPNCVIHD